MSAPSRATSASPIGQRQHPSSRRRCRADDSCVAKGLAEDDRAESRKGSSYEGRAGRRRAHTPRTVPRSRRNPGSELEASLELADPVEEFAHEHGARVVEPEVPA